MKSLKKKHATGNPFHELTWMDIQEQAGSKILSRGKSYQRSGYVEELGITKRNKIVAWVEGSARYATIVSIKGGTHYHLPVHVLMGLIVSMVSQRLSSTWNW